MSEPAPKNIYQSMALVMAKIEAVGKNKRCQQGASFNYRGIDDVYNALQPHLAEAGIVTLPCILEHHSEERKTSTGKTVTFVTAKMRYKFVASDGSSIDAEVVGEAMDSGDKATNKAMAIAHKYCLLQTFCIPTEDMPDPDSTAEELAPRAKSQKRQQAAPQKPKCTDLQARFFDIMKKRHGNGTAAMLEEISNFLGRKIESSLDLSEGDMSCFINAVQEAV